MAKNDEKLAGHLELSVKQVPEKGTL